MTLIEFSATRKVVAGLDMANFLEKYDPTIYEGDFPFKSIYLYEESYWIKDYGNGHFHLHIDKQEYDGTLPEMEQILYEWAYGSIERPIISNQITNFMDNLKLHILSGHTSWKTSYRVEDYPCGEDQRTTKYFWIETQDILGDRLVTCTIDRATGNPGKAMPEEYHLFVFLRLDRTGEVLPGTCNFSQASQMQEFLSFLVHAIGVENISEVQQVNIRRKCLAIFICDAVEYQQCRIPPEKLPAFARWSQSIIRHFTTCEFKDIADYIDDFQDSPEAGADEQL